MDRRAKSMKNKERERLEILKENLEVSQRELDAAIGSGAVGWAREFAKKVKNVKRQLLGRKNRRKV